MNLNTKFLPWQAKPTTNMTIFLKLLVAAIWGIFTNAFGERCRCATASWSVFFFSFFFFFVVPQRTRQVGVRLRLLLNVPWRTRQVDDGQVA
jgi:hypothetical protein